MDPTSFAIPVASHGETTGRLYSSTQPHPPCLVLAHGAGAGQQHPFMTGTAHAMAARGVDVVTFDFLYMRAKRRGPDRPAVLEATWRAVVEEVRRRELPRGTTLAIGGKSMGGRIASQVLASRSSEPATASDWNHHTVRGLVLLGYPLHPPGQPDKLRTAHLPELRKPTLVVQGSRDEFGREDEVRGAFAVVPAAVAWHIVEGGDHSLKVPKSAGKSQAEVLEGVYDAVSTWLRELQPHFG